MVGQPSGKVGDVLDPVLNLMVERFAETSGFTGPKSKRFEAFVAHSLFRHYHGLDLGDALESHIVDGGGDGGIDAVCVTVDGKPIHTPEGADEAAQSGGYLDTDFIFVQAKTSTKFDGSDIGTFGDGVVEFFRVARGESATSFNSAMQQHVAVARRLLDGDALENMAGKPRAFFYFVTAGTWKDDPSLRGRLERARDQVASLNLFGEVHAKPVDADLLQRIRREVRGWVRRQIKGDHMVPMPSIDGVNEAYLGLLEGQEFIKLISTTDGETLNRDLFYENVRDFQGDNDVNKEIAQTLTDESKRHTFPLLNNGITIVAGNVKHVGTTFTIENFQVVNGCQSTHVLFRNRDNVDEKTLIPVKLVVTRDKKLIVNVIKATNRQTQINIRWLHALGPFHQKLEDFYDAMESGREASDRLYYERREGQYRGDSHVQNVVTFEQQTQSFAAMFLDVPHLAAEWNPLNAILTRFEERRLFADEHHPSAYYAAGVCRAALVQWAKQRLPQSDRNILLNKDLYHVLLLLRLAIAGKSKPRLNEKKAIVAYSQELVDASRDKDRWAAECELALVRLKAVGENPAHLMTRRPGTEQKAESAIRAEARTEQILKEWRDDPNRQVGGERSHSPSSPRDVKADDHQPAADDYPQMRGKILWFQQSGGYGRIEAPDGTELFVAVTELGAVPPGRRQAGTAVVFEVGPDPTGAGKVMATQVRLSVEDDDVD